MTEKLYDADAFLLDFTATVLDCQPRGNQWVISLDRTAFFPEGGGQGADHGTLSAPGATVQVLDCHEKAGTVLHTADGPLPVGQQVEGRVDGTRRLSMMQQHSGEHIFFGLVHARFGYNNVGFHIGSDAVTMDFDGKMTLEQALEIESEVNRAIWKDVPVTASYPDPDVLSALPYRSKKEIDGPIRIVTVEGYDVCACCGTHVHTAGQIGQVKVVGFMNYKSGVRISILCGMRALAYENEALQEIREISHITSEQPGKLAPAVRRILEERDNAQYKLEQLAMKLFMKEMEESEGDIRMIRSDDLALSQLRPAAGLLANACSLALVLIPRDTGWNYALSSKCRDVRPLSKVLQTRFQGRGGGSPDMVQGILGPADPEALLAALQEAWSV